MSLLRATLVLGFLLSEEEVQVLLGDYSDLDEFVAGPLGVGVDRDAWLARVHACPADLVLYGDYGRPGYLLAVRGTEVVPVDGAREVGVEDLAVPADRVAEFRTWCEGHDVAYREPRWFLTSLDD